MHRSIGRAPLLLGGMVIALIATARPGTAHAQEPSPKPSALIVPINGTIKLQMSTKKPIKTVINPKENAINIRTVVGDPTTILIIGQQPDVTRIELEDVDGNKETYEVIVQADIEYLRTQMRRAVPTANVTPIPTSNNTVILAGTVTRAEDVTIIRGVVQSVGFQYIDAMRVGGVQQVQLDVIIAQVSRSDVRSMAFNFFTDSSNFFLASTVGQAIANPSTLGSSTTFANLGALQAVPGAPNGNPTNFLFGVVHNSWGFLGFLEALRQENLLKLLAEPRLLTLSGRPASFLVGGEQAIPVPAGLGQIGVQFEEFGTRLNFIPIVLGNGRIHLEVEPEVSNLNPAAGVSISGTIVPGRSTNRINTTVELESGQTFVIGGLIQHQIQASTNKVPILGDLPFLGAFFSSKSYSDTEEEVLVIITPWLVDPESCDQRPKILPGEETRRPDDFELFLEGIIEAPRGPRQVCQNHRYVAAYKNSPSTTLFPCAGKGQGCGVGGGGSLPSFDGRTNPAAPMLPPSALLQAPQMSPGQAAPVSAPFPQNGPLGVRPQPMPAGAEETASPGVNDPAATTRPAGGSQ
jgi:pilus assembly protein CpaC